LKQALRPFQSDPEEELIEAMAKTIHEWDILSQYSWDGFSKDNKDRYRTQAKYVLAVVRERGIPT
jgi:hypothetical protein